MTMMGSVDISFTNNTQVAKSAQDTANTASEVAGKAQTVANNASDVANQASAVASSAQDTANSALTSANGKNTNFYGINQPVNPKQGDLWFKPTDNGNGVTPLQFDGANWVSVTDIIANLAKQITDYWQASSGNIDGQKIEPFTITSEQIDTGAINEAKMNWSTHLIF